MTMLVFAASRLTAVTAMVGETSAMAGVVVADATTVATCSAESAPPAAAADVVVAAHGAALVAAYVVEAERMLAEDTKLNEGIMKAGAAHIWAGRRNQAGDKVNVLTICNTGADRKSVV